MNDEGAFAASILGGLFFGVLVGLVIAILIAYLLYRGLKKIPQQYRTMELFMPWLTLVPIAGIVFYWILLPFKIPESFRNYFSENPGNGKEPKDYGRAMGLGAVISITCMVIPVINLIAWLPGIIFFILYMLQFMAMTHQIPDNAAALSSTRSALGNK